VSIKSLTVTGLGYVGLPTAAIFAGKGLNVLGVDIREDIVDGINRGEVHFVEPDLHTIVQDAVSNGALRAASEPEQADAHIIAVPTPFTDNHKPDLKFLMAAAESLAKVLKKGDLVIVESTVPVGTTAAVSAWLSELRPDLTFPHDNVGLADVRVAHSPERVLPGNVVRELTENDRVIGGLSVECAEQAKALYALAVNGECLLTTAATAELVKLSENAYRDVNIAFANELSVIADKLDIDIWEAVELANRHPRVNILQPGPGVGGHCIAVDPWFIVDSAPEDTDLIRAARKVNDAKPFHLVDQIIGIAKNIKNPVIACLGLSYKADIDDLRESPAVSVVKTLSTAGVEEILAVEPYVDTLPEELGALDGLALAGLEDALAQAHVIVLLVDHKVFKDIPSERLKDKKIVDARGLWRGMWH